MLRRFVVVVVALVLSGAAFAAQHPGLAQLPRVDRAVLDAKGLPTFLGGELGRLEAGVADEVAPPFVQHLAGTFGLGERLELQVDRVEEDELGQIHVRLEQRHRGLPVVGADMIVHADMMTGTVTAFSGRMVPVAGLPDEPLLAPDKTIGLALEDAGIVGTVLGEPELTYVVDHLGEVHLAWTAMASYVGADGEELDRVFVDAMDGELAARHPQIHRAKYRKVYTANNGTSLPGSLLFQEGGSSSDQTAMGAYTNAGTTYDYYSQRYGRDSYNDAGAQLVSTVHYSSSYNNAFWNGSQMVYGDGDGSTFGPFARAFDVVAHELTHAVTEYTANLTYSYESGALNEAMSDIFAASAEAWRDGGINSDTWKIGEDCYTPSRSGDALRYMDNPTADGSSYDYYPERYTGSSDNGGVHLNSGIANLAYVLLAQGGTHPRGKTTVSVPALGLSRAEQIFYRALTTYMTSSTNFEGARNATAQAAQDLYGSSDASAVQAAWNAVGVPGGPVSVTTLSNGVPRSNLSGATGAQSYYVLSVPAGASSLDFSISGGSGDCDLYVRRGSMPTTSAYDCRPYKSGNTESCSFTSPASGDWYVMLRAYSSYSGVTLTGSSQSGAANTPPTANFSFSVSGLTATFSDTSSDADGSVTAWSWSFGDGGASSTRNPSRTYAAAGTYSVRLTVTDDDGATNSVTRSVTVTAPPGGGDPCTSCTKYTGTLSSGGSEIQPGGTYYYSGSSGYHEGWLEGPAGTDFDVYLYKWSGSRWTQVASGTSSSSSEHIRYSGTAGYYYWKIVSYSGSGSYAFWLSRP